MGVLDVDLVYLVPTYPGPQLLGGLLLGVGFVIGGYCPGTSVAALSTGRVDGMAYALGIFAGTVVYGESYGAIKDLVNAGARGALTLPEVLNLPWGVVVFAVVLIAVGGFYGATAIERRFGGAS